MFDLAGDTQNPRAEIGLEPPFPLVLFQHASTVCKETVVAIAGTLSRYGLATIGIDIFSHGSRSETGRGTCETPMGELFRRFWTPVQS